MGGKKQRKGLKHAVGGFASPIGGINSDRHEEFAEYLGLHAWSQAVRAWKRLDPSTKAAPAAKRETLKRLIYEGRDHMEAGAHNHAAACYCKALALDPNNLDGLRNLAMIDLAGDRAEQGLVLINQALSIRSDVASLWSVKMQCLGVLGRNSEAQEAIERACSLGLERSTLLLDLATRLMKDQPDAAIEIARSLLQKADGEEASPLISLIGMIRQYACFELEEQIDWWAAAAGIHPSQIPSVVLNLQALAGSLEENQKLCELLSVYRNWCEQEVEKDPLPPLKPRRIDARPIRIGIVSGDFNNHVVARFLLPLLEGLDMGRFEVVCLSTRPRVDDYARKRFETIASFVDLDPSMPKAAAALAREQKLDICVDAAGFTAYSASQAFAWRMAPLQLSMIGYPGSTFVPNMDLLLADRWLAPEHDWMHPEDLLMIDGLAYCMDPPDPTVTITEHPPQCNHGFINFGILVNPYKFRRDTIRLWAEVLKATPNSQMAIVRPECRSLTFQANILQEFEKNGIPDTRVIIVNNHGRNIHYLDCYNKIDVILDSFPMTGGTSTYEAILMGLPVITLEGPNYHQRISKTVLMHAGLDDCIAKDEAEYVRIASHISKDVQRLTHLRKHAKNLRNAPKNLCDSAAYAHRFEEALQQALRRHGLLENH